MGFLDDAAKAASGAMDALGAGSKATPDSTEKPEWGDSLKKSDDASPRGNFGLDQTGSNVPNPLKTAPIEFIHYSLVHKDDGLTFQHNKFTPPAGGKGEPPTGRAIMFRDALEREAIMLHGFLSSCKLVMAEYLKNKGIMGDAAQIVGGILGGGPSKPKPDPTQLDTYMNKVKSAGGTITPSAIQYKDIHQAGADIHQARANFKDFTKSLREFYIDKDDGSGGGPLGALDKAVGSLPGPAKILMTVQKIGFSMFDIYLGVFIETQQKTQRQLELASHQMTLDAITTKYEKHALTFPIWSPVEEPKETDDDDNDKDKKDDGKGGFSKSVDFMKPVKDEAKKIGKEVDDVKKDIYDFAGANDAPKETPGTAQLTKIFSTLKGGESGKDAGSASEMTINALDAALKSVGGLPDFMKGPIREIIASNMSLLEDVYQRLMALQPAEMKAAPITIDILETAGRRHLESMLVSLPVKLLASVLPAKLGGGGKDVGVNDLSAQQLITHQIEDKLGKGGVGKIINKVLDVAIGQLADNLETVRKKAAAENCLTMEVFLGRLPWLTALMFRNTFFVMWNELVKVAFGPAAGFLDKGFDSIAPGVEKAKDAVDTGEEAKRRAENLNKVKDEGANVGTGGTNLDKYKNAVEDETDEGKKRDDERKKQRDANQAIAAFKLAADPTEGFPISARVADGEGKEIKEPVPSILPDPTPAAAATV